MGQGIDRLDGGPDTRPMYDPSQSRSCGGVESTFLGQVIMPPTLTSPPHSKRDATARSNVTPSRLRSCFFPRRAPKIISSLCKPLSLSLTGLSPFLPSVSSFPFLDRSYIFFPAPFHSSPPPPSLLCLPGRNLSGGPPRRVTLGRILTLLTNTPE